MHATLTALFESLACGFLWLDAQGVVRYANQKGVEWTGSLAGQPVRAAPLRAAVERVLAKRQPCSLRLPAAQSLDLVLSCRVLPGLNRSDAMVMLAPEHDEASGGGLETLMTLIRADLAAPLNELTLALRSSVDRSEAATPARLLAVAEEVEAGLAKLLDLAQVFGAEPLVGSDRIEMPALFERVWSAIRPLARARGMTVRVSVPPAGEPLATVYGSTALLQRVIVECLESVLRSTPAGGTADISMRQLGPRLLIVFRSCGMFAPPRPDMQQLDLDAYRGASRAVRVQDAIGLALCQRIVQMHGGTLREEVEDGTHDVLLDLPTGAPASDSAAVASTDQLQRYASDLARLMSHKAPRRQARAVANAGVPSSASPSFKP